MSIVPCNGDDNTGVYLELRHTVDIALARAGNSRSQFADLDYGVVVEVGVVAVGGGAQEYSVGLAGVAVLIASTVLGLLPQKTDS